MSRKLKKLNDDILSCHSLIATKQCLLAERAIYFGRRGDAELAHADLAAIEKISPSPDLRVSAMRNICYGVLDFYCAGGKNSIDKAMRGYSLAAAGKLFPEKALSAAWLSHFFDSRHDVESACRFAMEALALTPPDSHDTRSRAELVIAQNLGIAGRPDLAAPWYSSVLQHANATGDDLTVSALMFNRSMERVSCWRQSKLQSQQEQVRPAVEAAAAASACEFDDLVGNHGLQNLNPLLIAQILSLRSSYQAALDIYSTHLPRQDFALRMQADFIADHSLCLFYVGKPNEARDMMETAVKKLIPETHPDDRAATFSRASILYRELGDVYQSEQYGAVAAELWKKYSMIQLRMISLFSKIPRQSS